MKHYNVQIPNPCSESWDSMSGQGNGRFCNSCEKTISDYSKVSDAQLHYILEHSNGEICGRFNPSQLNRPINGAHTFGPDLLAVVLGVAVLMTTYSAQANEVQQYAPEVSLIQMLEDTTKQADQGHDYIDVRFIILDKRTHEPVIYTKVEVVSKEGISVGRALSDFDGNVTVKLSPDDFAAADSIRFTNFEYNSVSLPWKAQWKDSTQNEILMEGAWREVVSMMGVVVFHDPREVKRQTRKGNRREKRRLRQENRNNN